MLVLFAVASNSRRTTERIVCNTLKSTSGFELQSRVKKVTALKTVNFAQKTRKITF